MMLVMAECLFLPGSGFVHGAALLIKDGVIEVISDPGTVTVGHRTLTFPGMVLSPPFCDYHLHFSKTRLSEVDNIVSLLMKSGIARVYEAGDRNMAGIEMKKAMGGRLDIRTSGYALYKEGSYGNIIGRGVSDFSEAMAAIDHLHSLGVNYIKLITSGIFSPESGTITEGGFEGHEIREIIGYASGKGLPVVCHANGDRAIRDSAKAGAWGIVHGFYVADETLSVMAERGVRLIPTVNALLSLTGVTCKREQKERVERLVDQHLAVIAKARDMGVRVLPGSDSGPTFLPYGSSYLRELELFRKAEFSEEEILSSAVTGPLEHGKPANFLLLKGLSVEKVFVNGTAVLTGGEN